MIVITHYQRLLDYIVPGQQVHVLSQGRIVRSGGREAPRAGRARLRLDRRGAGRQGRRRGPRERGHERDRPWPDASATPRRSAGADLPWLVRLREDAIDRFFADEGWPTTRRENWRHTSLAFMAQRRMAVREAVAPEAVVADLRARYQAALGAAQDAASAAEGRGRPPATTATGWSSWMGTSPCAVRHRRASRRRAHRQPRGRARPDPRKVEAAFGQAGDGEAPAALNAALAADGAWIRLVPRRRRSRRSTSSSSVPPSPTSTCATSSSPRPARRRRSSSTTRPAPRQHADHRRHPRARRAGQPRHRTSAAAEAPEAIHLATIEVERRGRGVRLALAVLRRAWRATTSAPGSPARAPRLLNGLYHADGRRHVDHHTRIDHARAAGHQPRVLSRPARRQRARVFTGRILVAQDAQRTDAMQRCDNLLLSRLAEADARP